MPRFYNIVKPSANKAAAPGKEKKAGKQPGAASGKEGSMDAPPHGGSGQEQPESAG